MSCSAIDRAYLIDKLRYCFDYLRNWVGTDVIAYILLGLGALILAIVFRWVGKIVIPVLAEWVERHINTRAKETFNGNALQFEGFRFTTCVASVSLGLAFYALVKVGFHFLQYWSFFLAAIVLLIVAFTAWGVQSAPLIRLRPFVRHFYIPVVSAVGLLVFNAVVELAVAIMVMFGQLITGT